MYIALFFLPGGRKNRKHSNDHLTERWFVLERTKLLDLFQASSVLICPRWSMNKTYFVFKDRLLQAAPMNSIFLAVVLVGRIVRLDMQNQLFWRKKLRCSWWFQFSLWQYSNRRRTYTKILSREDLLLRVCSSILKGINEKESFSTDK